MTPWLIGHGWPSWTGALANHLWQSTAFTIAIGLLALAFRSFQARVRYALWFSASVKFAIPVSLLVGLGTRLPLSLTSAAVPAPVMSTFVWQLSVPFDTGSVVTTSPPPSAFSRTPSAIVAVIFLIWIGGVLAIAYVRWRAWRDLKARIGAASDSSKSRLALPPHVDVRWMSGVTEPSVLGLRRPIILLPRGIDAYLTKDQLDAVIAHELCHIDRHDNLTAALHMVVEAVFWFHPFVWLIGQRLIHERERACDEYVLTTYGRPDVYAQGILNVCRHYLDARLSCTASVGGSHLKERIKLIVSDHVGRRLNVGARLVLVLLGIGAISVPLIVGAQAVVRTSPQQADTGMSLRPAFEVASIREAPSPSENVQTGLFHVGMKIDGSRADYGFMSLADLIPYAYRVKQYQVLGPSWLGGTRWNIVAKIPDGQPAGRGPEMMQTLLAERFKLEIHRVKREQPVYALVVSNAGPRLKEAIAEEESPAGGLSIKNDANAMAISGGAAGTMRLTPSLTGGMQMEIGRVTMARLADVLTQFMDRPVVDATQLKGTYQVALDVPIQAMAGMTFVQKVAAFAGLGSFGARSGAAPDPDSVNPIIIQSVKSLGLELQPRKAPIETIVVDRLEKTPTPN